MALVAGSDAGVGVARFFDGCPTADGCPYCRWMSLLQMDVPTADGCHGAEFGVGWVSAIALIPLSSAWSASDLDVV